MLGRLKHLKADKKDLIIGLCGCMAQEVSVVEEIMKDYKFVNFVLGTHNLHELPKIIDKAVPSDTKRGQIDKEDGLKMYFSKIANPLVRFGEEDISITEYIKRQVLYNDILTIHSLLKDDILIRTYLSEIKSKNTRDKLDNTFNFDTKAEFNIKGTIPLSKISPLDLNTTFSPSSTCSKFNS